MQFYRLDKKVEYDVTPSTKVGSFKETERDCNQASGKLKA
jgi:hypothetical protein